MLIYSLHVPWYHKKKLENLFMWAKDISMDTATSIEM